MELTELIVALAIAFIHPFFFEKLTDKVLGYDTIDRMCRNNVISNWFNYSSYENTNSENGACYKKREKLLDEVEMRRHITLLAISLVSIFISVMIKQKSTKFGVGFGGIILLIWTLLSYWREYNENAKLMILGASLASVLFVSYKFVTDK